ncbi:uncharacterized protein LOC128731741 isoform X1 [Anopheles nili]|uniref:uncharacterized protein LOC128731741 isoform X1 n=1 Tax=Anopheles nili TaxID=185578 RepID=UPI00237AF5E3|nr:uncharacterized protein LOC128731741 isoform X1 [Anopheles nili]
MNQFSQVFLVLALVALLGGSCQARDVARLKPRLVVVEEYGEKLTTLPPPPKPYAFTYSAGRSPGHVDRTHSEVSDGSGVVRGSFSYVDPRNQVRTVEYTADAHGFYPVLSHLPKTPQQTEAVAREQQKHHELYAKIAQEHAEAHSGLAQVRTKTPRHNRFHWVTVPLMAFPFFVGTKTPQGHGRCGEGERSPPVTVREDRPGARPNRG